MLKVQGWGSIEIVMIDVGQGDAIALRSPRGRWVLVDAGPPDRDSDPGAHPVVRALRARAVSRLEAMFLTHPDLDHTGGAAAVLASFEVGAVYDPGIASGKEAFVGLLEEVSELGLPWRAARRGDRMEIDGLSLTVLHPSDSVAKAPVDSNSASVVVHLRYGSFDALLTGDADKWAEARFVDDLAEGVEVLKVGHHGSDTSTDRVLLEVAKPELALIPVGRRNRYGHPDPAVLERLRQAGVPVRRTDQHGSVSIRARRDGSFVVSGG